MSNIMNLKSLRNKPSQNAFDLSYAHNFTAKIGELLPVFVCDTLPGDTHDLRPQHHTITQPLNSRAFVRLREHVDYFFVPYNLLWNKFNTFITQMEDNVQQASSIMGKQVVTEQHPYFTNEQIQNYLLAKRTSSADPWTEYENDPAYFNQFGFLRSLQSAKLLSYLGYGDFSRIADPTLIDEIQDIRDDARLNTVLNPFPLLAYQKIYQDYFRNSQWESSSPETWNLNYIVDQSDLNLSISSLINSASSDGNDNLFDLKYVNWQRDYFTGVLPNAQYGEVATLTVNSSGIVSARPTFGWSEVDTEKTIEADLYNLNSDNTTSTFQTSNGDRFSFISNSSGLLNIIALRQAEFLQKYKEIAQTGGQDYESQIEKFFGIGVSSLLSDKCQYLGGYSSNVRINEVVNNNFALSDSVATIKGKGEVQGNGHIKFENKSGLYGVIIGIYHCVPIPSYSTSGQSRFLQKSYAFDYAHPSFDKLGMQQTRLSELVNSNKVYTSLVNALPQGSTPADVYLGYAPRYAEYKTSYDRVSGAFTSTLSYWQLFMSDDYISTYIETIAGQADIDLLSQILTPAFFKVNPKFADNIFAVQANDYDSTDQLLVSMFTDHKAVRKLDYNGLPY